MPYPEDFTATTRHLCAAAYLDEDFRDTAIREVYRQPHRAVAPSYGFTLGPVLGHCVRSGSGEQLTPGFDHGARLGVRELTSPPGSGDLGSHPDVRKHQRLIEHRVLAAIRDFLAARGVEPSSELTGGRLSPVPQRV
ncbi:hypothetical protein AMIS_52010 [Actinoplanes missouriensis 431]|uniref:Uncharacterized protein n=1 Tax=Actinoplanes missouriensis (strain ATCC 14538 / DSM 43046 / CBS 188.64 / JCM 3121 / NBRC 102363 / NCIMB 12654 / NRRL B-3342 / UNCC 431) TaxID=512565 RepID=I0HBN4_ACTM4|nr:hypothetical protein [Actinoplanes missouriensis]BAL90421.1 hypothetical protein AMIS_52010 [Actinoplanes missouriensis 431]